MFDGSDHVKTSYPKIAVLWEVSYVIFYHG